MNVKVSFKPNGVKIKMLIVSKGMNQSEFAKFVSISRTYLSLIINDKVNVSLKTAKNISNKLDVDPNAIFLPKLFTNSETKGKEINVKFDWSK